MISEREFLKKYKFDTGDNIDERCYFGPMDNLSDGDVIKLLTDARIIALVGASNDPSKPSYDCMEYLLDKGYNVIPVNPFHENVLGIKCIPSLQEIEYDIDIVNIFRNPAHVVPIIKDAISLCAKSVWMQMGVVNKQAFKLSEEAGLMTIMNRCIKVEHNRLIGYAK